MNDDGSIFVVVEAELPDSTYAVMSEVLEECKGQDQKWGEQNHDPAHWLAILAEEFGEAAKETVGITFAHPWSTNYRTELIQTAAVAIRMVESYDRRVREDDLRIAKRQMLARPRDLTDQQIKLLESQKPVPPRGEIKGQIRPNGPDSILREQQRKAGG